jgi:hypothetical protein
VSGHAVQQLETLLRPRRPACLDSSMPFTPVGPVPSAGVRPREPPSLMSVPSHQPSWDTARVPMQQSPLARVSPPDQPNYVTTPTTSAANLPRSDAAYAPHHHQHQHHQHHHQHQHQHHNAGLNSILEDPRHHSSRSPLSSHGPGDSGHAPSSHNLTYYGHHLPSTPIGQGQVGHNSLSYATGNSSAGIPSMRRHSHTSTVAPNFPGPATGHQTSEIMTSMTGHDPPGGRHGAGLGGDPPWPTS